MTHHPITESRRTRLTALREYAEEIASDSVTFLASRLEVHGAIIEALAAGGEVPVEAGENIPSGLAWSFAEIRTALELVEFEYQDEIADLRRQLGKGMRQ